MYEYTGANYPRYFETPHWRKLKEKFIYSNPKAKCWICGKTDTLLPHHEIYTNLFHEKLNKDIFILCFSCHTQLHFSTVLFFFKRKHTLDKKTLRKRRLLLKSFYMFRKSNLFMSIIYIILYSITS